MLILKWLWLLITLRSGKEWTWIVGIKVSCLIPPCALALHMSILWTQIVNQEWACRQKRNKSTGYKWWEWAKVCSGKGTICVHSFPDLSVPNSVWCRVFLEKLTVTQLGKKLPIFYRTKRYIIVFMNARHWCLIKNKILMALMWARLKRVEPWYESFEGGCLWCAQSWNYQAMKMSLTVF